MQLATRATAGIFEQGNLDLENDHGVRDSLVIDRFVRVKYCR